MLRYLAISAVFIVGAASAAHADVYRWVDEHGGVHYSDQWVPGSQVIKSSRPRPPSSSAETARRTEPSRPTADNLDTGPAAAASAEKSVKQDMAKIREQRCKEAKERYEKAIQARRIYKAPESDKAKASEEREYLSEEDADKYRVQARKDMDDLCGPASK
jgi:hypothetical protein